MVISLVWLRRRAGKILAILLMLAFAGIVLPRLVAMIADHFIGAPGGALPSSGLRGDITERGRPSWFDQVVAWLRQYYQGGD